jgi:transcriptional regulator with XRE-family HTH domain
MIEARQVAGLTQTEIATRMGASQSVVARLKNARHTPTPERSRACPGASMPTASISTSCRVALSKAFRRPGGRRRRKARSHEAENAAMATPPLH